jgi:anti-sigma B factor antagonist
MASLRDTQQIRIDLESHAVVMTAEGELDAYVAPALTEALESAGIDGRPLVADLTKVSFLDSTALGVLVRTVREIVERGGQARVVLPESPARRIFEITSLDRLLPLASSRADALRQLGAESETPQEGLTK